jgi:cytochrome oxidase assembly protein ShyY1
MICRRLVRRGFSSLVKKEEAVVIDSQFGDINATVPIGDVRDTLVVHRSLRDRERQLEGKPVFDDAKNVAAWQKPSDNSPIVYSSTTTGQMIYPAEEEDIEILSQSKVKFADPRMTEGSVVIRIVRLSDPVTSPVSRVARNRFFGIRGTEKWTFLAWGLCASLGVASLGVWQLRRMDYKAKLIERRQKRLNVPKTIVKSSPFPWNENNLVDWEYRPVEVTGVFDHSREMFVGPRATGISVENRSYGEVSQAGYAVVTPLMLSDGSTMLVNRGTLSAEWIRGRQGEDPEWVTVRGILVSGELSGIANDLFRVKNNTTDKVFIYLVPSDLSESVAPRNHSECKLAIVSATDVRYHDNPNRVRPPFKMKKKSDYMCFYADEHMHFNYAMQWFGMASVFLGMTVFKFAEMVRWRW